MATLVATNPRLDRASPRPWSVATAVLAGQAMASLDTSIVNVAAPTMQRDLHLSTAALQLAIYGYVLVYAVTLVVGARLGSWFGYGRIFLAGTALFTAMSLACSLAVDAAMLVAARALQGLGAALLVPQVLTILQITFTGERRRRALGGYGLVLAVGVAAGQVLGGLLVSADLLGTSWRAIFVVNLPVGLAVLAYSARRLPAGSGVARRSLDVPGATLLAAILTLITPLTFGADAGWPWWVWPSLAAGLLVIRAFVGHERRLARHNREPLLDLGLITRIRGPLLGIFVLMGCYGGLLFTTALYLQQTLHESALRSGLTFAGYAMGFAAASLLWSRLPPAWHLHLPAVAIGAIAPAEAALAAITGASHWPWYATTLLAVAGAGHGAGFGALVHRAAGNLAAEHAASLSGIVSTTNQVAIVAGIATAGALYDSVEPTTLGLPAISWVLITLAAAHALAAIAAAAVSQ